MNFVTYPRSPARVDEIIEARTGGQIGVVETVEYETDEEMCARLAYVTGIDKHKLARLSSTQLDAAAEEYGLRRRQTGYATIRVGDVA